jgi:type IV pilus assembly protein PilY1
MRSDLVAQTYTESSPGSGIRLGTTHTVNYDPSALTAEYGWRIDLPESKERSVVDSDFIGEIVFFNTLIPSTSPCSAGGEGWLMNVDMLTGGMPGFAVIDVNNNGDFSDDAVIGGRRVNGAPASSGFIDGDILRQFTAKGDGELENAGAQGSLGAGSRRISWTHLEY